MTYLTIILRKNISNGFLLKVILKIASLSQKITLNNQYKEKRINGYSRINMEIYTGSKV
jgi:hypothetical protein